MSRAKKTAARKARRPARGLMALTENIPWIDFQKLWAEMDPVLRLLWPRTSAGVIKEVNPKTSSTNSDSHTKS